MSDTPYTRFNFELRLAGEPVARFIKASGLGPEMDTVAYREGGGRAVRHLPGKFRVTPLQLRFGQANDDGFCAWAERSLVGEPDPRDVELAMLEDGAEARVWRLFSAWATNFRFVPDGSHPGQVTVERLTLVYDRMERG
ncbi:phage tail protein [Oceanicola sp. D3]|uniref:phage tail protein n=1 Tax=Oceanicola sp. D3 TaxID=2587163 RepID=UPI0011232861|nr:phage tail protein [Oceanicola sp. D3]QDC10256.1 phage tail protein [Oceanicola sp. D3]